MKTSRPVLGQIARAPRLTGAALLLLLAALILLPAALIAGLILAL
jgi:hypothetical protein